MHESEKWKWSRSVCLTSSDPTDSSLPGSSVHGIFQARVLEWGYWVNNHWPSTIRGFLGGSDGKEPVCNVGDLGSIPGLGRFPGGGHGNPLQESCLENPMDREAWRVTVYRVTKSQTWLKQPSAHTAQHKYVNLTFHYRHIYASECTQCKYSVFFFS